MQPCQRRVEPRHRGHSRVLGAVIVPVLLAGCGVLELSEAPHDAVVLEPAQPAGEERWTVLVELLRTEIDGEAVVTITFEGHEVSCVDAGSIPAQDLVPATELRFDQGREGVEQRRAEDEPPVVSGVELAVHCD